MTREQEKALRAAGWVCIYHSGRVRWTDPKAPEKAPVVTSRALETQARRERKQEQER
jgi:hypothetical protein